MSFDPNRRPSEQEQEPVVAIRELYDGARLPQEQIDFLNTHVSFEIVVGAHGQPDAIDETPTENLRADLVGWVPSATEQIRHCVAGQGA